MEFLLSLTLAQWAAIGTLIVAVTTMIPRTRGILRSCWRKSFGRTYWMLAQHIVAEESQLTRIEAELHPNHGTSLRDALNQIAERQYEFDAFLRAQLNIHDVALFRTNTKGELTMINRQYQRITGYSFDEVRGGGYINAVAPSDRSRVAHLWDHAVKEGREFHEDITFERPNGEQWTAHANIYREQDARGKICGYLGVIIPLGSSPCPYAEDCHAAPHV
jgi:PAS domain S-box-containing protein